MASRFIANRAGIEVALNDGLDSLIERALEAGVNAARTYVPVDTGNLHDSIRVLEHSEPGVGTYGVDDVDYCLHVEFGTANGPEQPYLRPSIDAIKAIL